MLFYTRVRSAASSILVKACSLNNSFVREFRNTCIRKVTHYQNCSMKVFNFKTTAHNCPVSYKSINDPIKRNF